MPPTEQSPPPPELEVLHETIGQMEVTVWDHTCLDDQAGHAVQSNEARSDDAVQGRLDHQVVVTGTAIDENEEVRLKKKHTKKKNALRMS